MSLWTLVQAVFVKEDEIVLDTKILRLHSRLSFRVFLISSALLTIKSVIGDSDINCFDQGKDKDENLNAYCWVQSTYSITQYYHDCRVWKDCIYPGVGQLKIDYTTVFHKYYQFTSAALFFQAVLCFTPRFIWKCIENGLQKSLCYNRKLLFYPILSVDDSEESVKLHLKLLIEYFKTHFGSHRFYFLKYCFCELLGAVITVSNIFLIDWMLNAQFVEYGSSVLSFWLYDGPHDPNIVSPIIKVFPLLAKCHPPSRYGPGGNIVSPDPLCILPLNALNSKIYLFLWFYLCFVLIVSGLGLLYRLCTFFTICRVQLLKCRAVGVKNKIVEDICARCSIGDWFVIYIMSQNCSSEFLQEFLELLWENFNNRKISV